MNEVPEQYVLPILLVAGVILLSQGTALFLHARSHGGKAWLWGLWGLTQFPSPTLTYMLVRWLKKRKAKSKRTK